MWAAVVSEFDTHEQTLLSTSRLLVDRRLDDLAAAVDQAWFLEQFARRVLDPLFGFPRCPAR